LDGLGCHLDGGWIGPGHSVLDGDPAHPTERGTSAPKYGSGFTDEGWAACVRKPRGSCLLWRNGRPSQLSICPHDFAWISYDVFSRESESVAYVTCNFNSGHNATHAQQIRHTTQVNYVLFVCNDCLAHVAARQPQAQAVRPALNYGMINVTSCRYAHVIAATSSE